MSDQLGIDLWIKRDDLTGLALGGNKGRKLEYLAAEMVASGAEAVVTCGALQSNFIRQLAAVCAILKVRCVAAVMPLPYDAAVGSAVPQETTHNIQHIPASKIQNRKSKIENLPGSQVTTHNTQHTPPSQIENRELKIENPRGNVLLDQLFGAELHPMPNGDWQELYDAAEQIAQNLEKKQTKVYRVPIGGSSPLGGYAFYEAAQEIASQAPPFDYLITATSSGSTQAGLTAGLKGTKTELIGIASDPEPDLVDDVLRVAHGLADLLKATKPTEKDFEIRSDWAHPGYGIPSERGNHAIEVMARTEGILLDPIYTGKAFAALLELAESKEIQGRVLFWHTGGLPSLFA